MDWLQDTIRREGQAMFSEHPSSEDLVLFVEAPEQIHGPRVEEIEHHLRVCAGCTDDVARLAAVIRADAPGVAPESASDRVRGWFRWSQWVPALAVAAIALAVFSWRESTESIVRSVGQPAVLRTDVERGVAETLVPDAQGLIALTFTLPAAADGAPDRCRIRIESSAGHFLAEIPEVRAMDTFGSFMVSLDARNIAAGHYVLIASDPAGEVRFPFTLGADD